ncbi:hypothetical protein BH11BAC3_BH11BAC3_10500 [soil metagenome]
MKNNIHTNPLLLKMVILITCFMLVMLYNESYAAKAAPVPANKSAIQFQHNAEKNELSISINTDDNTSEKYQLFIFTADGLLVKEIIVTRQNTTTVKAFKKGDYLYELFDKDTKLKSGLFTMK